MYHRNSLDKDIEDAEDECADIFKRAYKKLKTWSIEIICVLYVLKKIFRCDD